MSFYRWFSLVLIVHLFYGFSITLIEYAIPADALANAQVAMFEEGISTLNAQKLSADLQSNVQQQFNIPVVDLGALLFYSGNIVIDLILNSTFAVPQMMSILLNGVFLFMNIDAQIKLNLVLFATVVAAIIYFLGILSFVLQVRQIGGVQA